MLLDAAFDAVAELLCGRGANHGKAFTFIAPALFGQIRSGVLWFSQ